MNLLFICEIDFLRKIVFDVHLLPEAMSLLGHNVYVLYYESMWGLDGRKTPREMITYRALSEAKVNTICPAFIKFPVLSRISAFVTHYFEIARVIEEKEIDAIVLYSVPTNGLQAVHWAKKYKIPIVFRSIDALNQLVKYPVLNSMTKWMEKMVYSKVDRVLTLTPRLSDYVVGLGASYERVSVLPMTVDTDLLHPLDDNGRIRERWGLSENDKVVLFMGTLFNFSGLDTFIEKFDEIESEIPEAKLLIVGDGEQRNELEKLVDLYGLQNKVVITGFQPYMSMPKFINIADVCVNTFVRNKTTKDIFPGKTVQFLACGKPLVMRPLDGVKSMILGEEQGVVYADDDSGMAREVVSLLQSAERRNRIGQNGLRYARENHGYDKVAKQLEVELNNLVKGKMR